MSATRTIPSSLLRAGVLYSRGFVVDGQVRYAYSRHPLGADWERVEAPAGGAPLPDALKPQALPVHAFAAPRPLLSTHKPHGRLEEQAPAINRPSRLLTWACALVVWGACMVALLGVL